MLFLSKSIASVCLTLFWKNDLLLDGQVQYDETASHAPLLRMERCGARYDAVRCNGQRSALHRPSQRAASAIAARYIFLPKTM